MSHKTNGVAPAPAKDEKISLTKPGLWTIKVTPDLAYTWLTKNWDDNRRLRPVHIQYLAEEMKAGRWQADHPDALLFSKDGKLIQGQHRLNAVIEAGIPVEMRVETGVDESLYPYLDSGLARGLEDRIKLSSSGKDNRVIVMIINHFRRNSSLNGSTRTRTSPEAAYEIYKEHQKAMDWVVTVYKTIRGVGRIPVMAAAVEMFERHQGKAKEFMETLMSTNGEGPVPQARILRDALLRRYQQRGRIIDTGNECYRMTVSAMKAFLQGRQLQKIGMSDWAD